MPHCFQLISKATGKPTVFDDVDVEICKLFNARPDPKWFFDGWYDHFGLAAVTYGWEKQRELNQEYLAELKQKQAENPNDGIKKGIERYERLVKIHEFLEAHYEPVSWWEAKQPPEGTPAREIVS